MSTIVTPPWKHISVHVEESIKYVDDRRKGIVKSMLTPWPKVNAEFLNGIEWGSVVQIAGNSGSGKTLIKDQLIDGFFSLNQDQNCAALDYQFEMLGRTRILRDGSRGTGMSIKELSSAERALSDSGYAAFVREARRNSEYPIYIVDDPKGVEGIEKSALEFYRMYNKPMIAAIDHSMLVERKTEKDDFEVIRNVGKMLIRTKKAIPIIWLVLNQYNREFEDSKRQVPNSIAAFPTKKDIYGGDAIYFASDIVIGISKPDMYLPRGTYYGPSQYNMKVNEGLLVLHILKNRMGKPNQMIKMSARYHEMRLDEA